MSILTAVVVPGGLAAEDPGEGNPRRRTERPRLREGMGVCAANIKSVEQELVGARLDKAIAAGVKTLGVTDPEDLAAITRVVRGKACDLKAVALDDQGCHLYVPILNRTIAQSRSGRSSLSPQSHGSVVGELIVRGVEEFSIEGSVGIRWFEIDTLVYEEHVRQLSIRSGRAFRFLLTVERLDVALRINQPRLNAPHL